MYNKPQIIFYQRITRKPFVCVFLVFDIIFNMCRRFISNEPNTHKHYHLQFPSLTQHIFSVNKQCYCTWQLFQMVELTGETHKSKKTKSKQNKTKNHGITVRKRCLLIGLTANSRVRTLPSVSSAVNMGIEHPQSAAQCFIYQEPEGFIGTHAFPFIKFLKIYFTY